MSRRERKPTAAQAEAENERRQGNPTVHEQYPMSEQEQGWVDDATARTHYSDKDKR